MSAPLATPTRIDRPYWESGRDGVLRLQRCTPCGHILFPPGLRCTACGSPDLEWAPLSGRGTIWSWVRFEKRYFVDMPPPYLVLRVRLEEGPALMLNLVESGDREPAIGDAVRIVFVAAGDLFLPQAVFA